MANNELLSRDEVFQKEIETIRQEIDDAFDEVKRTNEQNKKYSKIMQVVSVIFWLVVIIAIIKNWIL